MDPVNTPVVKKRKKKKLNTKKIIIILLSLAVLFSALAVIIHFTTRVTNESYANCAVGDVNGDGKIDGQDAVILKAYASLMLDPDLIADYTKYAGDLNFDGNIGNSDVKSVENAGVRKETINQAPSECIGKFTSFIDLANAAK